MKSATQADKSEKHAKAAPRSNGHASKASLQSEVPLHPILRLQQTIGNQAVLRLMRARKLQAKLAISQPGDVYEREADRVADQVMWMPDPTIQRACGPCSAGGGTCPKCAGEGKALVQRRAGPASTTTDHSVSDNFISGLGSGRPLDASTRAFFEPRFGTDFSHVRVHTDGRAAESAWAVNALAYTVGRDVVFGAGQYAPGASTGQRLLAHELTHVMQQSGTSGGISRAPRGSVAETISRMPRETISRACHEPGFPPNAKVGDKWYSHDFVGPIPAGSVRAVPANAGYAVPSSSDASYNCMGWAVSEFGTKKTWQQGVNRDASHPWPEEELLTGKGCKKITSSATADHKVRLYEYKDQDQFHIVRQECDGRWSGKTGAAPLWRGVTSPEDHTTSYYSQPLSNLRITDWSCG